jgi:N-acetylglucosaminyldiphosphoundecaprenol N-acetyl-beta-D-mannosaminyltransferase
MMNEHKQEKEVIENIVVVHIGGAPIASISKLALMQYVENRINVKKQGYVCFCEAHLCVRATYEKDIRKLLTGATLVLPDGVAMSLGSKLLGKPVPERLPGPTVMLDVCQYGMDKNFRHYFYGGAEGAGERLIENLLARFPGLQVAGVYCPPFRSLTEDEDQQVIDMINESRPDIVWVGLGAPKQEKWMFEHQGKIDAPVMMGVGAAFDFHSGTRKWAPAWIRKIGCEWIYRMFTGGKRVFWRNVKHESLFVCLIMKQRLFSIFKKDYRL